MSQRGRVKVRFVCEGLSGGEMIELFEALGVFTPEEVAMSRTELRDVKREGGNPTPPK